MADVEKTTDPSGAEPDAGLTTAEAERRRLRFGPNDVPEEKRHPARDFLRRFWGLTAWMLELIIVLSWALHKYADAAVVAALLAANAVIGFREERKASRSVDELKAKLGIRARTRRDGAWTALPACDLVPGDVVRLRQGDVVPADVNVLHGAVAADESALTGESLSREKAAGDLLLAGSVLRRGETTGVVAATGTSTRFGRTVQLVQTARPRLHMEEIVARLVKILLLIIGVLLAVTLAVSTVRGLPPLEILPLMLVLLLSAIPVALPAMFTVSTAVGARALAREDVLVTRLSATEDAATMDVLCVDKTGTLTLNELAISEIVPFGTHGEDDVVLFGALASEAANQDPVDIAFLREAAKRGAPVAPYVRDAFLPFDPDKRRTEALVRRADRRFRILKGAVPDIGRECGLDGPALAALEERAAELSLRGAKTIAVAVEEGSGPALVGLAALADRLRPDSQALVRELQSLGLSLKMLTGDALPIARETAAALGLGGDILPMADLKARLDSNPAAARELMERSGGFAEVYPEDKHLIVRTLQAAGHVVGMTGDGVNDAPALKQAEVGIAVASAADVAKASASVVLTSAGLSGIVALVENGRQVYQRIATWVLNKIMRTVLKTTFVVGVYLATGDFVVSAFAMVLLLLMTDFMKISLSTDRVRWSPRPETWRIGQFAAVSAALGVLMVTEALGLLAAGLALWHLRPSDPSVPTFSFEILFFSAVLSIFVVRERRRFWSSAPSRLLGGVMSADMLIGIAIATLGIPGVLPPIPASLTAFAVVFNAVFTLAVNDFVKTRLLRRMRLV